MRESDNTLVDYALGYGKTISEAPYLTDFQPMAWDVIVEHETEWKKRKGFI
jgi:branched-chain amino acid transport system substrate-binding protein